MHPDSSNPWRWPPPRHKLALGRIMMLNLAIAGVGWLVGTWAFDAIRAMLAG